ncbi:MAG: DUF4339 domain-containing protein [Rubritalea sp.]|uniref:DUF4339 domain-containing protein n=1 Tax=Rubritalea sp. TaxID=2109375 RepID=UPI0032425C95
MSEQESVWFYTQHGERKGPVTVDVLRGAIEHMKIDREKDLIWGPGLSDWVTMDNVPELQGMAAGSPLIIASPEAIPPVAEASKTPPAAPANGIGSTSKPVSVPAPSNPYESSASIDDDNALADAMAARRESVESTGIGRLAYFLWSLMFNVVGIGVIFNLAGKYKSLVDETGVADSGLVIGVFVTFLVIGILSLLVSLSRLKNLSMSRWNFLWSFVPFANIWLGFRLIACPPGYALHKKLDTPGKVMLALFIAYMVLCAVVPFLFSGYYKDAEEKAQQDEKMFSEEVTY